MRASQLFPHCVLHAPAPSHVPPYCRQRSARRASGRPRPRRREDVDGGDDVEGMAGLVLGSWEGRRGRGGGNGNHGAVQP